MFIKIKKETKCCGVGRGDQLNSQMLQPSIDLIQNACFQGFAYQDSEKSEMASRQVNSAREEGKARHITGGERSRPYELRRGGGEGELPANQYE